MLDCQPGGLEFKTWYLLLILTAAESVFSEVVDDVVDDDAYQSSDV